MAILLFTDFGAKDLYVGQVEAVLARQAPGVRAIHLLHEAPRFDVKASAHLLAALAQGVMAEGDVLVGVVDPGVGSDRPAVAMRADGRWYVGPDNGLLSVVAARAPSRTVWRIAADPAASASFHGRDVFAPAAAAIATERFPDRAAAPATDLEVRLGGDDLAEIVYLDHYGNAWTGLRARGLPHDRALSAAGRAIPHARVFAEVPAGAAFWYENSSGLVEIAVNRGSAAATLGLALGQPVSWAR